MSAMNDSEVRWLRNRNVKRPLRVGEKIALECSSRGGAGGGGLLRPWPNITWYIGGKRVGIVLHRVGERSSGHTAAPINMHACPWVYISTCSICIFQYFLKVALYFKSMFCSVRMCQYSTKFRGWRLEDKRVMQNGNIKK